MIKRIIIICNKKWEFAAFTNALNYRFTSPVHLEESKKSINDSNARKETFSFNLENGHVVIETYCLQDFLNGSSSETNSKQKYKALGKIFNVKNDKIDLTISIGTGTSDCPDICNGSVLVGGNTCVYNPFKNSPDENLLANDSHETISKSSFIDKLKIENEWHELILKNVLPCPNIGGSKICFEIGKNILGLSVTNIVNFDDYSWADIEAVNVIKKYHQELDKLSLDTTHGMVRWFSSETFLFVNGITNRIGEYKTDFEPNYYTQGYAAAFNCGVVFKFLLQHILKLI